jgi:hypothetical protein
MQSIHFPKSSFRTAIRGYVRRDGHGLDECLWRELLQNARDAGATKVVASLVVTEETITLVFADNGKGMDKDTLTRGMLTYSGSVKEAGNAGGFGMAKNVIAFASESTTFRTRDNAVRLEGINYEWLEVTTPVEGCELTIVCDRKEQCDLRLEPTVEGLRFLLARCDLRGLTVYLDGVRIDDCRHEKADDAVAHTFDGFGGKAYYWKRRKPFIGLGGSPVAILTHKGIWVCDLPLPAEVKGCLLIDTERDAKSVLNDTRTNLSSYSQRYDLERWMGKLNQGAQAQLKTKRFVQRYDGGLFLANAAKMAERCVLTRANAEDAQQGAVIQAIHGPDAVDLLEAVARRVNTVPAEVVRLDSPTPTPEVVRERLSGGNIDTQDNAVAAKAIRQLLWKPALMIVNERDNLVPKDYLPATMSVRAKQVLQVWSELVRQYLVWTGEFRAFGVGFVFSDEARASFREETDGTVWFLINPLDGEGKRKYNLSSEESRNSMIVSAGHEVAHCSVGADSGHGDQFAATFGDMMRLALNNAVCLNRIWKTCR